MKGSDTLEDVTKAVITSCVAGPVSPGNTTNLPVFNAAVIGGGISYVGGGSGGGQAAILAGQQLIAPMSRPLNGAVACPGGTPTTPGTLDPRAEQLLIGLDGLAVVGSNHTHGDSLQDPPPAGKTGGCDDKIASIVLPVALIGAANCQGVTIDGCDPAVGYTFNDWKDVLAMLYGGQNHTAAAQLLNADPLLFPTTAPFPKTRNPARISCTSPIRKALADNWGNLFETNCGQGFGPAPGNAKACVKLKHAFRRGDLSGTTDTFVTLTGMVAIPAFSNRAVANFEAIQPATATANAFCNAGTKPMNKGHSDYLDLDPIRRIADAASASVAPVFPDLGFKIGYEQLAWGGAPTPNPPANPQIPDNRNDPTLTAALVELCDFGAPSRQTWGPDPTNPAFDYPTQVACVKARKGLGLVLPVEIPTNYSNENQAYFSTPGSPFGGSPLVCNSFALSIPDSAPHGICPDGQFGHACTLPVHKFCDGTISFNCLNPVASPARAGAGDERIFNFLVLDEAGHFRPDAYNNPNTGLAAIRQPRVVSAFFRLNATQVDTINGVPTNVGVPTPAIAASCVGSPDESPAAVNNCKQLTSTDQIGCLVKANPCSIGFAGREAVDKLPSALNSFAYQLGTLPGDERPPTDTNIYALRDPLISTYYPMSRKLFVNKWSDPAFTTTPTDPLYTNEQTLYNCFKDATKTNPAISAFHFLPILTGPLPDPVCPNNR